MNKIVTRKWKNGRLIQETSEPVSEELQRRIDREFDNAATVTCECGNSFPMPRDALFGLSDMYCGQCGKSGLWSVK